MDQNSPDYYVETTENSLQDTEKFIHYVRSLKSPRINPIITPRFAPACSSKLMLNLGKLAETSHCPIQSHLSENPKEVEWIHQLFPTVPNYCIPLKIALAPAVFKLPEHKSRFEIKFLRPQYICNNQRNIVC